MKTQITKFDFEMWTVDADQTPCKPIILIPFHLFVQIFF